MSFILVMSHSGITGTLLTIYVDINFFNFNVNILIISNENKLSTEEECLQPIGVTSIVTLCSLIFMVRILLLAMSLRLSTEKECL